MHSSFLRLLLHPSAEKRQLFHIYIHAYFFYWLKIVLYQPRAAFLSTRLLSREGSGGEGGEIFDNIAPFLGTQTMAVVNRACLIGYGIKT